jgi:hypothetical protein
MNRRGFFLGGAGMAGLILLGNAGMESVAVRRAEAEANRSSVERAELGRKLALNRERIAAAETEAKRLRAISEAKRALPAVGSGGTMVTMIDPKTAAALEAIAKTPWRDIILEKSPELQALYLAVRQTDLASLYGPFFSNVKLAPDQIARFKEMLNAADERALDLKSAIRVNGWSDSDPTVATLRKESDDALHTAERTLLGDDGYQQLGEYERALPARAFVGGLATSLLFDGEPLSGTQVNQLTQILSDANEVYRSGGSAAAPIPDLNPSIFAQQPAHETIDADQVLARARLVLSPAQFVPFEAEIERSRSIIKLYNVMRQAPGDPFAGFTIVGRK